VLWFNSGLGLDVQNNLNGTKRNQLRFAMFASVESHSSFYCPPKSEPSYDEECEPPNFLLVARLPLVCVGFFPKEPTTTIYIVSWYNI